MHQNNRSNCRVAPFGRRFTWAESGGAAIEFSLTSAIMNGFGALLVGLVRIFYFTNRIVERPPCRGVVDENLNTRGAGCL